MRAIDYGTLRGLAVFGFWMGLALGSKVSYADDAVPAPVQAVRPAGPLELSLRTNAGHDVHLRLDTPYATQSLGDRLTPEQMEKLGTIRMEAPSKFQILTCLFPREIAEYLLRAQSSPSDAVAPADDAVQRLVWEIGASYITQPDAGGLTDEQRHARADFVRASLKTLPPQPEPVRQLLEQASKYSDPDFDSPAKADAFLVLKDWYSPYRRVGMSIIGDTLRIDGRIVTERLSADAAASGEDLERYADEHYGRYMAALKRWQLAQVTGNAYAGSIRRFLNDPRLAEFTPQEVSRAYQRVFGRNLQTDLEADRAAARLGHPVTYNELRAVAARKE